MWGQNLFYIQGCEEKRVRILSTVKAGNDVRWVRLTLVPRLSPAPVFDRLQYAKTEHAASDQKLEPGKAWERGQVRPPLQQLCVYINIKLLDWPQTNRF